MAGDRSRPETTDNDPYDSGRTETEPHETARDTSAFPYSWAPWGGGWGLQTNLGYGRGPDGTEVETDDEDSGREEGVYSLLIVAGAALFLFPEPATSMVGVLLLLLGAGGWLVDAMAQRGAQRPGTTTYSFVRAE